MSVFRRHLRRLLPYLLLAAGCVWLWIALRHFDRLSLIDGYQLPEYRRGRFPHRSSGVLLPGLAGLLFLIAAAVTFLRSRDRQNSTTPGTLFGSGNGQS